MKKLYFYVQGISSPRSLKTLKLITRQFKQGCLLTTIGYKSRALRLQDDLNESERCIIEIEHNNRN